jgi:hypothetical protein
VRRTVRAALVLAVTLPFLIPLFRPGWLQSHEGVSYPVRLVQVARCWDDGLWSARWFPDLNYGQGYPFLCFYAPLFYWLAGAFHAVGAGVELALKLPVALATLLGAAGAWRLVRTAVGPPGALAAAALYTYAPYRVRDVFIRGDLAEHLALGFLPWSVWALVRLARRRSARDVAMLAGTAALPILAHNIVGLLTGGMLALSTLVAMAGAGARRALGAAAALGGASALLLAAFFWAPALQERAFVRIDILTSGHYVVEHHFAKLSDLLGRGQAPGLGQALPMTFEIGWVGLGAVLLAPFAWRSAGPPRRLLLAVGALFLGVGVVMTTAAGAPVYDAIGLLRFVQFPWRFLSIVALGVAVLGGTGVGALAERWPPRVQWAGAIGVAVASVLFVAPILGPKPNGPLPAWSLDPAEYRSRGETTTRGEYLPVGVPEQARPRGFVDGVRVDGGATVLAATRRAGRWDLTVEAAAPATLALEDLWYPGWSARVDGRTVPVRSSDRGGHVELEIDAGRHDVVARFEPTPFRRSAQVVSLATLLAGAVTLAATARRAASRSGARFPGSSTR